VKNRIIVVCLVLAGIMGLGTHASTSAFASGNSDAAHGCQHGGYLYQLGTDGITDISFTNAGECASYATHGGVLVSLAAAQPCLNGGYQSLTSADGAQAFTDETACVLYVGLGGTPVPFASAPALSVSIVGPSSSVSGACALAVSGSGLMPGTHIMIDLSTGGSYTMVGTDGFTPVTVGADGKLDVTTYVFRGYSIALSGTAAAGGTITSTSFDTSC
jgi:hypothetical protein